MPDTSARLDWRSADRAIVRSAATTDVEAERAAFTAAVRAWPERLPPPAGTRSRLIVTAARR